jgi:hypothetical protein
VTLEGLCIEGGNLALVIDNKFILAQTKSELRLKLQECDRSHQL